MKSSTVLTRVGLAGVLAVTSLAFAAPQASAATDWRTNLSHSKGKLQLCKVPVGGKWTIKMRLDNRKASHWHKAWAWQTGTHKEVTTTARAGRVSTVRKLRGVPRGSRVGVQLGHKWGAELGHYGIPTAKIRRC